MAGNFVQPQAAGINWTIYGLERFSQLDKPNFIPFFLLSTPRLAYSFYDLDVAFKYEMFSTTGARDDYISPRRNPTKLRVFQSSHRHRSLLGLKR